MDVLFLTTRLEKCYRERALAQKAWGEKIARTYVRRIDALYASPSVEELYKIEALHLHALKGARKGQYALWLDEFWRLVVTFQNKQMTIVRVEEVRKHYGD